MSVNVEIGKVIVKDAIGEIKMFKAGPKAEKDVDLKMQCHF